MSRQDEDEFGLSGVDPRRQRGTPAPAPATVAADDVSQVVLWDTVPEETKPITISFPIRFNPDKVWASTVFGRAVTGEEPNE